MSGGNSSSSSESLQISSGISSCSEIVMHVHNLMHVAIRMDLGHCIIIQKILRCRLLQSPSMHAKLW